MSLLLLRCSNIPHSRELIRTVLTDRAVRTITSKLGRYIGSRYPESILNGPESICVNVSVVSVTGVHCTVKSNLCILSYAYVE